MHALYRSQLFSLGFLLLVALVFGLSYRHGPAFDMSLSITILISCYSFGWFIYTLSKLFRFKENSGTPVPQVDNMNREEVADAACFLISGTVVPGIVAALRLSDFSLAIFAGCALAILGLVSFAAILRGRQVSFFAYLILAAAVQFVSYYYATDENGSLRPAAIAFLGLVTVSAVFFLGRQILPASER